ncbi:MAG TPA: ComF family protein [Fermentimonas sp.]|nr:ComF family protein [Fermentimonas sp.]
MIIDKFLRLFLPETCVVCGVELLKSEIGACLQCLYKLPRTNNFKKVDNAVEIHMAGRIPFERIATFSVFTEAGILPPMIHHLKYRNGKDIGLLLGKLFGKDLLSSEFIEPIEMIVPVPLHQKKMRKRGYNQAEVLARGISEITNIPVSAGNLIRVINNPTQTKQTKAERWENVIDIFEVKDVRAYENKHILLVDDVITTGSTIEACGLALQKCKGIKISIATIGGVL